MKLHDLHPAPGSTKERTRVGRGIAAGKGKTAGRGTKGQKARAGGSIPAWFEGGQTPLNRRIPKLRGFKNRFRVEYQTVNVGRIAEARERGAFSDVEVSGAPLTINAEVLRVAGLIRGTDAPLKVLGGGDLDAPLFVIADAFTASARTKIEAAGGTAQQLVQELPVVDAPATADETQG
jgi:large subunit ribosomal protein L15